jgi:hypothetical protein
MTESLIIVHGQQDPAATPSRSSFCTSYVETDEHHPWRKKSTWRAPEQLSYQLTEVDPFFSNEVKSEFTSIPKEMSSTKHGKFA